MWKYDILGVCGNEVGRKKAWCEHKHWYKKYKEHSSTDENSLIMEAGGKYSHRVLEYGGTTNQLHYFTGEKLKSYLLGFLKFKHFMKGKSILKCFPLGSFCGSFPFINSGAYSEQVLVLASNAAMRNNFLRHILASWKTVFELISEGPLIWE